MRFKTLFIVMASLLLYSCEEVIEVDLPNSDKRIVVDGIIRVDVSEEFVPVEIKVTRTNGYFDAVLPISDIESIFIQYGVENEIGELIDPAYSNLTELEIGSGIYVPDPNFTSDQRIRTDAIGPGTTFWLFIEYEDRIYASKTGYATSVPITSLEQGTNTLFDDETEVIISYTDDPDVDNFYVFDFGFANFFASEDTFYQGQDFSFSYFYDEELEPGEEVTISILGSDLRFYNYMNLILQQTDGNGGIFDTPVATVRGNVFDVTGINNISQLDNLEQPNNFPLGYFSVSETYSQSLLIE